MLTVLASTLPLFASASQNQDARFWDWFVANEAALYQMTSPEDPLIQQLGDHIQQVDKGLTFEIGLGNPPGTKRELIISADGLKAVFPAVEALHAAAPKLQNWQFIKFRPSRHPMAEITLRGQTFDPATIRCVLGWQAGKLGVVLMHDNFDPHNDVFTQASFILLDAALGEYVMETEVGAVSVQGKESKWLSDAFPMTELPFWFEAAKQQRAQGGS
jgi:hypothetical protein